ncbi:MAG: hypothetical protein ACOVNR_10365, partial [Chitinophagaceae bacterium]
MFNGNLNALNSRRMKKLMMKKILLTAVLGSYSVAYSQGLPANFQNLLNQVNPKVVEWRRHFHQNPE